MITIEQIERLESLLKHWKQVTATQIAVADFWTLLNDMERASLIKRRLDELNQTLDRGINPHDWERETGAGSNWKTTFHPDGGGYRGR